MVAISDGDGGGGETRVVVTRQWVGVMKDGDGVEVLNVPFMTLRFFLFFFTRLDFYRFL